MRRPEDVVPGAGSAAETRERSPRTATATSTSPPRRNAQTSSPASTGSYVERECGRPALAEGERAADQVELRGRLARREQPAAKLPVDRPAVVRVDEREERAARRPGRCPARPGEVSLSSVIPSDTRSPCSARRSCVLAELLVVEQAGREALRTFLPLVILVDPVRVHLRLAQRLLEVEPEPIARRAARRRRRSAGSGTPRSGRASPRSAAARAPPTSAGSAAMQASRARTSPLRFVSCVVVASRPPGGRARFGRVEALDREREPAGSPPTSFSATKRFQR